MRGPSPRTAVRTLRDAIEALPGATEALRNAIRRARTAARSTREVELFASAAARRSALRRLAALALALAVAGLLVWKYAAFLLDPAWIREAVRRSGPWAPLTYVAVQAAQVILAPIPGQTLGVAGGYLFGPAAGAVYSLLGVFAGSAVVFALARRLGRPYVERVLSGAVLERFDGFVRERGVPGLFVVFLLPTFPDDAVCALAGITTVRTRTFLALVALGRAPTFVLAAYLGHGAARGRYAAVALAAVGAALLSVLVYAARDRLPVR